MRVKPLLVVGLMSACSALMGVGQMGLVQTGLAQTGANSPSCPGVTDQTPVVTLAGLDRFGDPLLEDGRTLRLVGLAPRQDDTQTARFAGAIEAWRGRDVRLVVLAPPDRWGRLPARLLVTTEGTPAETIDLAAELLQAKAALRLPEPAFAACDEALRKATGEPVARPAARPAARTVGANPALAAADGIDGLDLAALKAQAGRIVVMEGRVVSIGERQQRTYLNFSRQRGGGGAIVVSRRLWREMQDAGWTSQTLTGRRVRARGLLGGQDGLLLEAASLAALDLID